MSYLPDEEALRALRFAPSTCAGQWVYCLIDKTHLWYVHISGGEFGLSHDNGTASTLRFRGSCPTKSDFWNTLLAAGYPKPMPVFTPTMKLAAQQLRELHKAAALMQHNNPEYGVGQCYFNALEEINPEVANALRGTEADTFYASSLKDKRMENFLKFLTLS